MGVTKEQYFTGSGLATRLYNETITKYNVGIVPKEVYPPVYMTKAQASEIAQLRTAIDNYVQESTARFIIGELDIDKSWDAYVKELGNIGVAKYIDISQKAYDAQYGKK
jgi:putative aldouronate transport system substrate-binding protein